MEPTNTTPTMTTMFMPAPTNPPTSAPIRMGMSTMAMTFFPSTTTPLFWDWWTPRSTAAYAATCVFLICLAAVTRVLVAVRPVLDARVGLGGRGLGGGGWGRHGWGHHQHNQLHDGGQLLAGEEKAGADGEDPGSGMVSSGLEGDDGAGAAGGVRRWWGGAALGLRLWRASCEAVLVCLGYFLMIAVMTMNTGYFVSVLSGVFLGMFLLGSPVEDSAGDLWHQC
ncbi:Ctr copper transporter family-domain-containing protein [Chaetomium tenue]|uniref:Ctr copper transporter family-domain-containing protein n=1 Tax=Chaetomium tenue TaxID=1854479 RepID=A0ACB7P6Q7_9PEZI|nr:Ctr copper transporter family-domain-containing protein [Chaetomium globosum]